MVMCNVYWFAMVAVKHICLAYNPMTDKECFNSFIFDIADTSKYSDISKKSRKFVLNTLNRRKVMSSK